MEAEYIAIIYGLNEYFLKWNKQLDARQYNGLSDSELTKVSDILAHTKQPLPDAVLVCCDNEVVIKQLSRQYHIANDRLRKLAQQVWDMTKNVEVTFQWVPRKDNLAGFMLK
jgi:ribonuclease HI